jgi:tetratricopeptide (TPR) repeat protein
MYPYLSPHGLIMKINRDKTPYNPLTAQKDQDFWDWYVRRLVKDPMYRRDFAAQKSFSKLRAAIAGLYSKQARYQEAGQAFREACLLYPASPEATFRYAQEALLPFRRWNEVLDLMDYTDRIDPNNTRTPALRGYVERVRRLTADVERLETKRRGKTPLEEGEIFTLARCYFEMGRTHEAAQLLRPLVERVSEPAALQAMATILLSARMDADAEKCLTRYLKAVPDKDALAWADLAKIQHRQRRTRAAQQSFINGYRINAQLLFGRLQKDQELYEIAAPLFQQRR